MLVLQSLTHFTIILYKIVKGNYNKLYKFLWNGLFTKLIWLVQHLRGTREDILNLIFLWGTTQSKSTWLNVTLEVAKDPIQGSFKTLQQKVLWRFFNSRFIITIFSKVVCVLCIYMERRLQSSQAHSAQAYCAFKFGWQHGEPIRVSTESAQHYALCYSYQCRALLLLQSA